MNNRNHLKPYSPYQGLWLASLAFFALCLTAGCACHIEKDNVQIKEDVRCLLNDIDNNNDLDKYVGPDYVERLYKWSHNK